MEVPSLTRQSLLRTLAGLQIDPPCACFGARFAPRDFSHEAHLSAEQSTSSTNPWVPRAHGHPFRTRRACASASQRPQASERLILKASDELFPANTKFSCKRSPGRSLRRNVSITNRTSIASTRMHVALPMRCLPSLCVRMTEPLPGLDSRWRRVSSAAPCDAIK